MITGQRKSGEEGSETESVPGAAEGAEGAECSQESPAPAHRVVLTVQQQLLPRTTSLSVDEAGTPGGMWEEGCASGDGFASTP